MNLIFKFLFYNKTRAFIMIFSVFLSLTFFYSILGVSNGIKSELISQINKLSSDFIVVVPIVIDNVLDIQRSVRTRSLVNYFDESVIKGIQSLDGVVGVYKSFLGFYEVTIKSKKYITQVTSIELEGKDILESTSQFAEGRNLNSKGEAVIGSAIAKRYNLTTRDSITIKNRSFKIVGIFKEAGFSFFNIDNNIFVSYEDITDLENIPPNIAYSLIVKVRDKVDIYSYLDYRYKINDEKDRFYSVLDNETANRQISSLIDIVKYLFLFIAAIALFVSNLNITNNIYIFIAEKYKQIATLKVLGFNQIDIYKLIYGINFTILAISLILGSIVVYLISIFAPFELSLEEIIESLAIIFLSVAIFTYLPTREALSINPAEALKYE